MMINKWIKIFPILCKQTHLGHLGVSENWGAPFHHLAFSILTNHLAGAWQVCHCRTGGGRMGSMESCAHVWAVVMLQWFEVRFETSLEIPLAWQGQKGTDRESGRTCPGCWGNHGKSQQKAMAFTPTKGLFWWTHCLNQCVTAWFWAFFGQQFSTRCCGKVKPTSMTFQECYYPG